MNDVEHGGGLIAAAAGSNIPAEQWLDLSTGINPKPYPLPPVPESVWQRLPERNDGLEQAAATYYGAGNFVITPGSQWAIQHLPLITPHSTVGVISPTYAEHAQNWKAAGHKVIELETGFANNSALENHSGLDGLILVNPNNPDGRIIDLKTLRQWAERLQRRGGWLLVDEAFADAHPAISLLSGVLPQNVIVLRSIGKFFGLAGIRLGFVFADAHMRQKLESRLGPWAVSGPARWAGKRALLDTSWQAQTCHTLPHSMHKLENLLEHAGLTIHGKTALFAYCRTENAEIIHQHLTNHGILTRLFSDTRALRVGLPPDSQWQRLEKVLSSLVAPGNSPR